MLWFQCTSITAVSADSAHVSKLAADRTSRQHRSTTSSLTKQTRAERVRLAKGVEQLQQWHAIAGDSGQALYDPALLPAAQLEQRDWVVPWLTSNQSSSALQRQMLDMQQRIEHCTEEEVIIMREAKDAATFYTHHQEALAAAIHV